MKVSEFQERFGVRVDPYFHNTLWETRYRLATATKFIDYRCDFGVGGRVCRHHEKRVQCCCYGCGSGRYVLSVVENERVLAYMARLFSSTVYPKGVDPNKGVVFLDRAIKDGFWRAGRGCVLPRKYRSTICLTHNCLRDKEALNRAEQALLTYLKFIDPDYIQKHIRYKVDQIVQGVKFRSSLR